MLSENAQRLLRERYGKKPTGDYETPNETFSRVAITLAIPEIPNAKPGKGSKKYKPTRWHLQELKRVTKNSKTAKKLSDAITNGDFNYIIDKYYNLLVNQIFLPNTPTIINAGRKLGMFSACFVLPVDDDLAKIMETAKDMAIVQKKGGGTGFNFSNLRPKGSLVRSTQGVSSGPVSFMHMYDQIAMVISQGGVRRGANMGILEFWHPDVLDFIWAKHKYALETFNISVGTWGEFWDAVHSNSAVELKDPSSGKVISKINANELLHEIASAAWETGNPGILYFDNINRRSIFSKQIRWTNPCGEEPLFPYESCNLGSINVSKFVQDSDFDWGSFEETIQQAVRALDNLIDSNSFGVRKIDHRTKQSRRIGLGMMGIAHALFMLEIPYNSEKGLKFMERLAETLTYNAYIASHELSQERGSFPLYEQTKYADGELPIEGFYKREEWTKNWSKIKKLVKSGLRNAMLTTIAPTGSISMLADTSSGIEPVYSLAFTKQTSLGKFNYLDNVMVSKLSKSDVQKVINNGGIAYKTGIELEDVFVTALDMHYLDHIAAQALAQLWITDSISKTINLPQNTSKETIVEIYKIAHSAGCKGITIFRESATGVLKRKNHSELVRPPSRFAQKLLNHIGKLHTSTAPKIESNKCPICGAELVHTEGCEKCVVCGWQSCTIA